MYSGKPAPKWLFLKRMHMLYNLRSKQKSLKIIADLPEDERTLIFWKH